MTLSFDHTHDIDIDIANMKWHIKSVRSLDRIKSYLTNVHSGDVPDSTIDHPILKF